MKIENRKVIIYFLLAVLLVISFILRLWPIQISHWWDETVYLQHSEIIFSGINNYNEFNLRPPLLSIIFAAGYFIKHSVFTASIIVSLLGTLGVFFTFMVGKELYNEEIGILSSIFIGLSPFIVTASHWIMTDIPSLTFIIISFYLLLLAFKRDNNLLFLFSGIFFGISILTRFTSLILTVIILIYAIIKKINFRKLIWIGCGLAIIITPYLIWAQIKYGFFMAVFINANMAVSDNNGGGLFYIKNILAVYPLVIIIGLLIYIIYQILSIKTCISEEFFRFIKKLGITYKNKFLYDEIILWLWIIIFLLYISITSHKEIRYIIPIALPIYLLSAKGFYLLVKNVKVGFKVFVILLIVILSIVSFSGSFSKLNEPFINTYQTDAVKVSMYIKSLNIWNGTIYANNDYPVYAYYTGMLVKKLQSDDTNFYSDFPNNMPSHGFFIFDREIPKEPNYEWLQSNKKFKKIKEIGNLVIYEYLP